LAFADSILILPRRRSPSSFFFRRSRFSRQVPSTTGNSALFDAFTDWLRDRRDGLRG
jgi:hypothetical protein